ncbi:MAG TPA: hypothetical protein VN957_07255 [Chthoniobacterales bacterium]|jgi:hypothetical protein|nr:hypothetical protein [Chthoniobacterales bacterium]
MKGSGVFLCVLVAGCTVGPAVPKGQVTVQGRGSEALTNQGDPLMATGSDERKVPIDFAKGYAKGISDQVKRNYWAQQENQRMPQDDNQGKIRYYNATIPQHEDPNGVIRVQREVVIPIVE